MTKEEIIGTKLSIKSLKMAHQSVIKATRKDSIEINTYLDDISKILDFVDQMYLYGKDNEDNRLIPPPDPEIKI